MYYRTEVLNIPLEQKLRRRHPRMIKLNVKWKQTAVSLEMGEDTLDKISQAINVQLLALLVWIIAKLLHLI